MAENFRLQFENLYPKRPRLFIAPKNEAEIGKVICTYIQPTLLPLKDFYDWDRIADFTKSYVLIKCLESPTDLPESMFSSTKVVKERV